MDGPAAATSPAWRESPHATAVAELLHQLDSNAEAGLSGPVAAERLAQWGPNSLPEHHGKPGWLRFLSQFNDPLLYTLLGVGLVKVLLGKANDAWVIWSVTLINAVIGFVQESKAETAIAALARSLRTEVEVVRDGQPRRLSSDQLVPGDVVLLQPGDKVPADLRLLDCRGLAVDESALTGESVPVRKGTTAVESGAPLAERLGMAFAGSLITAGQARGLVVATGHATQMGQISRSMAEQSALSTPLTRKLRGFSRTLLQLVVLLAGLTFLVGLARGKEAAEMFDGPGGGRDPRGTAGDRHHHPGDRREPDGPPQRHHPQTAGRGSPGQHHGDLLRQDRHPHPEPDDGAAHPRRRRAAEPR
jgi:magnesium-transporting ATPase (P-type)